MKLDGLNMPPQVAMPEFYWHYEQRSEKNGRHFTPFTDYVSRNVLRL